MATKRYGDAASIAAITRAGCLRASSCDIMLTMTPSLSSARCVVARKSCGRYSAARHRLPLYQQGDEATENLSDAALPFAVLALDGPFDDGVISGKHGRIDHRNAVYRRANRSKSVLPFSGKDAKPARRNMVLLAVSYGPCRADIFVIISAFAELNAWRKSSSLRCAKLILREAKE